MNRFAYLVSLTLLFVIPSLLILAFIDVSISWPRVFWFTLTFGLMGVVWDIWATRHGHNDRLWIWTFNPTNTLGITIRDIPIEEYLFYVFTPVYLVLMWEGIGSVLDEGSYLSLGILVTSSVWSVLILFLSFKTEPRAL